MSNIDKIRQHQQEIQSLSTDVNNLLSQANSPLQSVLVESCYDETYFDANDIANVLARYLEINDAHLTKHKKTMLEQGLETLSIIAAEEKENYETCINAHNVKKSRIEKLQKEIFDLVYADFPFENGYVTTYTVPLKFIEPHKETLVAFLDEHDVKYTFTRHGKILFLEKQQTDADLRELIQTKIRESDPSFNFKSFAAAGSELISSSQIIDLLYL